MQNSIIAAQDDEKDAYDSISIEDVKHYAKILSDFQYNMSASAADKFLHVDNGTVARAYRRGEIEAYRLPKQKRPKFTPLALAKWLETYCKPKDITPLPD